MRKSYRWFVGVDWGGERHQVCVLDGQRNKIGERSIEHTGQGLAEFAGWLDEIVAGEPATMAAALEVPHGALVETLLAHGFAVFSINPKQLDRFRDRHTVGGAKDDRRDAFVLAASMVTDIGAYREVKVESPFIVRVRELSRTASDFEREHRRLCNQLRELLFRSFPAILRMCPAADEPWVWDLLAKAPFPSKAARLRPAQVGKILKAHRIRRIAADGVCEQLRSKALDLTAGTSESIAEHICLLIPVLQVLDEQRKKTSEVLNYLLDQALLDSNRPEHATVRVLRSLPGVGVMVATTLLSEANGALVDCDYGRLRCYAGVAPVTKQSGKSRRVVMRHGCNHGFVRPVITGHVLVCSGTWRVDRIISVSERRGIVMVARCGASVIDYFAFSFQCFDLASRTVPSGAFLGRERYCRFRDTFTFPITRRDLRDKSY